jgi:hypothetical protein
MSPDDYYLRRTKKLDSTDLFKGFAMARTLDGPAVGDADGCHDVNKIDSIVDYRNKNGLRCLFIHANSKTYCDGHFQDSSNYQGFFVDVSKDSRIQLIQIPNTLDMLENTTTTELYRFSVDNIRINK